MVPAMVGGAGLALVNMLIYGQTWSPYVPWVCPYLIASGEIAQYSTSIAVSYGVILTTFAIGLTISYIYFTRTDVSL
jgi:ABC-2 type transport system permease protein/bacitracin transport system permease protein